MRIGFSNYNAETKFPSREGQSRAVAFCRGGWRVAPAGVWFATIVAIFISMSSFADPTPLDRKTVSSKAYVDTSVETLQQKIPAANPNNTNIGVSVVTYTNTGNGTIGERQIYDGTNNYTNGDANKLVTASALKGSVTNLPTMETSKLTCANPDTCSLWTIEDQQVYGDENNNTSGN
jgi:hypothetical protein